MLHYLDYQIIIRDRRRRHSYSKDRIILTFSVEIMN